MPFGGLSVHVQGFVPCQPFQDSPVGLPGMGVSGAVIQSDVQQPADFTGGPAGKCNQTVMGRKTKNAIVDFAAFSLEIDRVHCVLVRSFLVRNWCDGSMHENECEH